MLDIQKLIKENYAIAKSKGFYPEDSKIEDHLMGIVSEIGECYEAYRNGKFTDQTAIKGLLEYTYTDKSYSKYYKEYISGTFEDELADIFIRLFNLCGWLGIKNVKIMKIHECLDYIHINQYLLAVNGLIAEMKLDPDKPQTNYFEVSLSMMFFYCTTNNIPIEKHILAKMKYNKTREYLHGKKY